MAAIKLRDGAEFDGKALAQAAYRKLPPYALPLFVRVAESLEHTSTFKSRKVDLRDQAYGPDVTDPLYVLAGRDEGYVEYYEGYAEQRRWPRTPEASKGLRRLTTMRGEARARGEVRQVPKKPRRSADPSAREASKGLRRVPRSPAATAVSASAPTGPLA